MFRCFFLLVFVFCECFLFSQSSDVPLVFKLTKGKKNTKVYAEDLVKLYFDTFSSDGDSIKRKVTGVVHSIRSDSILIELAEMKDNVVYSSYAARKNLTTIHQFFKDTVLKFSLSEIHTIGVSNRNLENSMAVLLAASLVTGLLVSPLVSLENGKLDKPQMFAISGISLGVAAGSLFIAAKGWEKRHPIKSKRNAWKIETSGSN